jgi:hypothetical protein
MVIIYCFRLFEDKDLKWQRVIIKTIIISSFVSYVLLIIITI